MTYNCVICGKLTCMCVSCTYTKRARGYTGTAPICEWCSRQLAIGLVKLPVETDSKPRIDGDFQ